MDSFLSHQQTAENPDDSEFRKDLSAVCQQIYYGVGQTVYASWEELQEDILVRYGLCLLEYATGTKRRSILETVVINLINHQGRDDDPTVLNQGHFSFDPDEWVSRPGLRLRSLDPHRLNQFRSRLSREDRLLFDEHFVNGRSLMEIAQEANVSLDEICGNWIRILSSLK